MSFKAPIFTNKGKQLYASCLAGKNEIIFTNIKLGDGELMAQAIADLEDLINPVKTIVLNDKKLIGNDQVLIRAVFKNIDISSGFYWREVGLYAQDPENPEDRSKDILFCYQNAGDTAEYIPSASSGLIDKILSMSLVVSDVNSVNVSFFSESYALKEDLDEQIALQAQALENHKEDLDEQIALQAQALDNHKKDVNAHSELFSQYVKKSGDTMSGRLTFLLNDALYRDVDTSYLHLCGGNVFGKSASLILNGGQNLDGSSSYGGFELSATNGEDITNLIGQSTGSLTWGGKNIVRSVNGVTADTSGNVTINAGFATPDYSASVSQAINTDYTAPSDGFIYGELSSHGDGSAYYILIDNTYVIGTQNTTHAKYSDTYIIFMVPIKKGTKYRFVVTVSETERPSAVNFAPLLK